MLKSFIAQLFALFLLTASFSSAGFLDAIVKTVAKVLKPSGKISSHISTAIESAPGHVATAIANGAGLVVISNGFTSTSTQDTSALPTVSGPGAPTTVVSTLLNPGVPTSTVVATLLDPGTPTSNLVQTAAFTSSALQALPTDAELYKTDIISIGDWNQGADGLSFDISDPDEGEGNGICDYYYQYYDGVPYYYRNTLYSCDPPTYGYVFLDYQYQEALDGTISAYQVMGLFHDILFVDSTAISPYRMVAFEIEILAKS
ncbi:MAG: hypothetical protein M1824_002783 [Vezdaea acicularis]|nr:MAG: hypothetical protein M1824_002783 [Vezdaea acicularis]